MVPSCDHIKNQTQQTCTEMLFYWCSGGTSAGSCKKQLWPVISGLKSLLLFSLIITLSFITKQVAVTPQSIFYLREKQRNNIDIFHVYIFLLNMFLFFCYFWTVKLNIQDHISVTNTSVRYLQTLHQSPAHSRKDSA